MANKCININSSEFKELVRSSGMDPLSIASDISIWQEKNDTDDFPDINQLYGSSFPGASDPAPVQKKDQKELDDQVEALTKERDAQVKKALTPSVSLDFIPESAFLEYDNARELRNTQKEIKKEFATLNTLIKCLTK